MEDRGQKRMSAIGKMAKEAIQGGTIYFDYCAESGGGIRAQRDIRKGELLIVLPFHLLLSSTTLPEASGELADAVFGPSDGRRTAPARVTLGLILQHLDSEYSTPTAQYCRLFPLDEFAVGPQAMLVTANEGKLDALSGSALQLRLLEQQRCMKQEFVQVNQMLEARGCDGVTQELYTWAKLFVQTRSMTFSNIPDLLCTIVPFADVFNHAYREDGFSSPVVNAKSCVREDGASKELCFEAIRDVKEGEELYICYNEEQDVMDYAEIYGFMDPSNTCQTVEIIVAEMELQPLLGKEINILREDSSLCKLCEGKFLFWVDAADFDFPLMKVLRYALLTSDERVMAAQRQAQIPGRGPMWLQCPILCNPVQREMAVLEQLYTLMTLHLRRYPKVLCESADNGGLMQQVIEYENALLAHKLEETRAKLATM